MSTSKINGLPSRFLGGIQLQTQPRLHRQLHLRLIKSAYNFNKHTWKSANRNNLSTPSAWGGSEKKSSSKENFAEKSLYRKSKCSEESTTVCILTRRSSLTTSKATLVTVRFTCGVAMRVFINAFRLVRSRNFVINAAS